MEEMFASQERAIMQIEGSRATRFQREEGRYRVAQESQARKKALQDSFEIEAHCFTDGTASKRRNEMKMSRRKRRNQRRSELTEVIG